MHLHLYFWLNNSTVLYQVFPLLSVFPLHGLSFTRCNIYSIGNDTPAEQCNVPASLQPLTAVLSADLTTSNAPLQTALRRGLRTQTAACCSPALLPAHQLHRTHSSHLVADGTPITQLPTAQSTPEHRNSMISSSEVTGEKSAQGHKRAPCSSRPPSANAVPNTPACQCWDLQRSETASNNEAMPKSAFLTVK